MTADVTNIIRAEDYPAEAAKAQESGTVVARMQVTGDGRPLDCIIVESSRSASLDRATCRIFMERARFTETAKRHRGEPFAVRLSVKWVLDVEPYERYASFSRVSLSIAAEGQPISCTDDAYWFGKQVRKEDCSTDPEVATTVANYRKIEGMVGRTLVIENHFLTRSFVPRPGEDDDGYAFARTLVEVAIGQDGKPTGCLIVEDNTDNASDPCAMAMTQSQGFGPPPKDKPLPKLRYLTVMYTKE